MEPTELPLPSPFNLTPLIQEVETEQGWTATNEEEEDNGFKVKPSETKQKSERKGEFHGES